MTILCTSDTEFADSCAPQFYTPPKRETLNQRIVLAVCCLAIFAAMGVVFAVGFSA